MKFKAGDIVEFGGIEGEIVKVSRKSNYPIRVKFEDNHYHFTKDGKFDILHTKPLLNLVRRPVQKLELSADKVAEVLIKALGEDDVEGVMDKLGFDID